MRQFTTGDHSKQIGDVFTAASHEPVVLYKHKKPRFVLDRLTRGEGYDDPP